MSRNTPFRSLSEMVQAGGFNATTAEEFQAIPDQEWDEHVRNTTRFSSWKDMLSAAGLEHLERKFKKLL